MPMEVVLVFNELPELAASLPYNADRIAEHAAQTLNDAAIENAPVLSGEMKASIRMERVIEGKFEVTVQKEEAQAGEKTYAWFNNDGTVHYAGSNFFNDAIVTAAADIEQADLFEGLD